MLMYNGAMKRYGFTLIELVVVIAVIGILAGITVASYGSWRTTTAQNEVKNDLTHAVSALENHKNFNDGYPSVGAGIPASFTASENVTVTLKSSTMSTFCVQGKSKVRSSIVYYASSAHPEPTTTAC